jgi:acyl carrier protein
MVNSGPRRCSTLVRPTFDVQQRDANLAGQGNGGNASARVALAAGAYTPWQPPLVLRYSRAVKLRSRDHAQLISQLKHLLADMFGLQILAPDDIPDDASLIGGRFDLDSLDLLELSICVEEAFGIAIRGEKEPRIVFGRISSLADFIHEQSQVGQAPRRVSAADRLPSGVVGGIPIGPFPRGFIA